MLSWLAGEEGAILPDQAGEARSCLRVRDGAAATAASAVIDMRLLSLTAGAIRRQRISGLARHYHLHGTHRLSNIFDHHYIDIHYHISWTVGYSTRGVANADPMQLPDHLDPDGLELLAAHRRVETAFLPLHHSESLKTHR